MFSCFQLQAGQQLRANSISFIYLDCKIKLSIKLIVKKTFVSPLISLFGMQKELNLCSSLILMSYEGWLFGVFFVLTKIWINYKLLKACIRRAFVLYCNPQGI